MIKLIFLKVLILISEETSRECSLCKFYYFLDKNFKHGPYLCDGCYMSINHNGNYYRVIFAFISKKDAYNLIKNAAKKH